MSHTPRKRFGQNFLSDESVIEDILDCIHATKTDHIVEIGPGLGALTQSLIRQCNKLDVIEIDRDLAEKLGQQFPELNIHKTDALKFDFNSLTPKPLRIVGNLPYNISTPLLFHLMLFLDCIADMSFMLQKEVVNRIVATPGNKNYGRLSIMIQYHCHAEPLLDISPTAFYPKPKVDSAFFRLTPHKTPPYSAKNFTLFGDIVRICFNHRRKTLNKILKDHFKSVTFTDLTLDLSLRPEQLSIKEFVSLSNYVELHHR